MENNDITDAVGELIRENKYRHRPYGTFKALLIIILVVIALILLLVNEALA